MATLPVTSNVTDPEGPSREQLDKRAAYRRAVEAMIWGMPAVDYDRMLQSFVAAGGGANQIAYWSPYSIALSCHSLRNAGDYRQENGRPNQCRKPINKRFADRDCSLASAAGYLTDIRRISEKKI